MELSRALFDWQHTILPSQWAHVAPWELLAQLSAILQALGAQLGGEYRRPTTGVWIHRTATVASDVAMASPCIVDAGAEIRPQAYLRGAVLVGKGAVVGHCTELKNCVLFDCAKAPHFNYVGDGILGYGAHLGAGVILSNVRCDRHAIAVCTPEKRYETDCVKLGALVGDGAEIGCSAVLNPGTVVEPHAVVLPLCSIRGYVPCKQM